MGVILIILVIYLVFHKKDDKKKSRRHKSYSGKSDWEKTCDDGGKFFGW